MAKRDVATEKALSQLQAIARAPDRPGARTVGSRAVPDDLRDLAGGVPALALTPDESSAVGTATAALLTDLRFEHLRERRAKELIWRLFCLAHFDRSTNHIPAFVREHARPPEDREVFFTVRHLTISGSFTVSDATFLPLDDPTVPTPGELATEPHVAGVVRVNASGTDPRRTVERARDVADHALRALRLGLRVTVRDAAPEQLRFRLGDRFAFRESIFPGWRTADDAAWELTVTPDLGARVNEAPVAALPASPRNDVERRALTALRWSDRAFLAGDPLVRVLYLFFALEAIIGDKAEKEKGRKIAFRRAVLDHATRGGFRNPHITYALYDEVRSAAVHGEEPPTITVRDADSFGIDVRSAINQFLELAAANKATKRAQVLQALDAHPDVPELLDLLRRTDRQGRWTGFTP